MTKPTTYVPYYDDIVEAMAAGGCAFCALQLVAAEKYIDSLLWESVNDPRIRREVSAARGFCRNHAWLLVRHGSALSSAIIYQDVVRTAARVTAETPAEGGRRSLGQRLRALFRRQTPPNDALLAALRPQQPCPVCTNAELVDRYLSETVLASLAKSNAIIEKYRASAGLCLHHFGTLLAHTHTPGTRQAIIDAQLAVWSALDAELAEFIRKNDHRFRREGFGAERDSWERAMALTSGPPPPSKSSRGGVTQTS
ncbi:MAG: hypothetical protein H6640_00435 [Caldilineaceae bacterium]|nr:hypothetical protein [Caldilineaceae bacterium]MCB9118174.1 hypothetical protein [Caldilineaceae bacterium]HRW49275.1 DUF6062 family protein [Caldilinea sp.]